jgi:DNA-binding transcriptional LysR family regulator
MLSARHEIFFEVAANASFSKAAEILYISQPAISRHIKMLEAVYRQPLFERRGNIIKLTAAGTILYNRLKEAKRMQNQLEFDMSTLSSRFDAKGELKLGASTTVALYIIPKILSAFHQRFKAVKINLLNRNTDTIIKALLEEEIDIGIVEGKKKLPGISYHPFMKDEVVAVCSAKSIIARKKNVTLKEFAAMPLVLREQGSGTLAAVKYALEKKGISMPELNTRVKLSGTEALKNFLREDNCLGFLPRGSIIRELKDGSLTEIKIDQLTIERNFFFIQRSGAGNNEMNKIFIRFCKEHL